MKEVKRHLNFNGFSEPSEIRACFENYSEYLRASSERFPPGALAYAEAPWHYDTTDPRCPHDAWLEQLWLSEQKSLQEPTEDSIQLTLLGAYHDGNIVLRYKNVRMYSLMKDPDPEGPVEGHSDWLIDELSLSDDNIVIHTIDWATGARWHIWCDDLEYEWKPFADVTSER